MNEIKGHRMDMECPICGHKWIVIDPKKPLPRSVVCPNCKMPINLRKR